MIKMYPGESAESRYAVVNFFAKLDGVCQCRDIRSSLICAVLKFSAWSGYMHGVLSFARTGERTQDLFAYFTSLYHRASVPHIGELLCLFLPWSNLVYCLIMQPWSMGHFRKKPKSIKTIVRPPPPGLLSAWKALLTWRTGRTSFIEEYFWSRLNTHFY